MINDDNNNTSPFKTSWAGQDAKIHAKKTTWSTGNYQSPEAQKDQPKPNPVDTLKGNTNTNAVYNWLLCKYLSGKLR